MRYRADTGCGTGGRMDGWTNGVKPIYQYTASLCGGYKYSQKTPHSSPVRASYGVSFEDPASDWYSAAVPVITYVISYNTGPRYNSTRLYYLAHIKEWNQFFQNDTEPQWKEYVKLTLYVNLIICAWYTIGLIQIPEVCGHFGQLLIGFKTESTQTTSTWANYRWCDTDSQGKFHTKYISAVQL